MGHSFYPLKLIFDNQSDTLYKKGFKAAILFFVTCAYY